ncbi:MAG TPA: Asp-tRNA(Asn)/Glu-tRNA(Gln) amidotransferase subunit GatB [Phycisphaerae bacterium]|nr:Asp-tRNA(Asn)/Glu-tRNA(Gln) amidotransferase subunit GatB [Phycisphaerae bacterium]HRY68916.1 Asp-tRNA(Asn)/Glu-tRNA(Gln) amidotransferase subunit GatB [Phycisphaerae bacterium]HSA25743.1 Asp-tRNA(Asn)/Glu-tRNA(Gln) amidotransferase subunit GatB [Phycisphaerae bacterium]
MDRSRLKIRPIIGLEIHVQLATKSKLFCSCPVEFGAEPNSNVCPVCLGMPGVLPVMNRQAFEFSVRTAVALHCEIAAFTKWDRKSYYYPDLPKNYQISQYDLPLSFDGAFDVPAGVGGGTRRVGIIRAHLEEDAGKNLHEHPGITRVDLNRTGTPLLEIVTEPDLSSADEAYNFCVELQRLVTYLGVSEGNMQKGQMRFEPNVNVAIEHDGQEYRTPISEVKNLNSFRAVRGAIAHEIERQVNDWMADRDYVIGKRPKENRGWDDVRGITEFQRSKEEAHDYRYFPDPDLVPVEISDECLERIRASVGELPLEREARMQADYGLSQADAATILRDRATVDLFEEAAGFGHAPTLGKQFISFWLAQANARGCRIAQLGIDAGRLGELSRITADGVINATAAQAVAEKMLDSGDSPTAIAERDGLVQVRDQGAMAGWVTQAFEANAKAVQDALANPKKKAQARGFLLGQVMKISGGQADPKMVGRLIDEKLSGLGGS